MPGIFGLLDETLDPTRRLALLAHMGEALHHQPWYRRETWANDIVAFGRVSHQGHATQAQPLISADHSLYLFFEGELYDTELSCTSVLKAGYPPPHDDAELVLRLWQLHGEHCLPQLHGVFSLSVWDERAHRLVIANDRFGLWPVYYILHQRRLLFAPEVKGLLADPSLPRQVNDAALAQFVHFCFVLGEATLLAGVQLLPPGSVLSWQEGQCTVRNYWALTLPDEPVQQPEAEVVEELSYLTRQAVHRRLRGPVPTGFLLSGGIDSRCLIAAVDWHKGRFPTFVFGSPETRDVRAACQIATLTGHAHHFFELKPDYIAHHAAHGVWLTDGMMVSTVMSVLPPMPQVREHVGALISGDCGDWILGGGTPTAPKYSGLSESDVIERRFREYYDLGTVTAAEQEGFFAPAFFMRVRGLSRQAYWEHNRRAPVRGGTNKAVHFALTHEAMRTSGYGIALLRTYVTPRLPYYDNDLFTFTMRVPPLWRAGRRLHLKVIKRLAPELMQVPWQLTGLPLESHNSLAMLQRARYRLQQRLSRLTRHAIPWPQDVEITPTEYWLRTTLRPWVESLVLSRRALERGYFRPDAVHRVVAEHMTGRRDRSYLLGVLITLELWHRQVMDGEGFVA